MCEPSRNLFSFQFAGFHHHDGALALGELKASDVLEPVPERHNPYDEEAIAVRYRGTILGYIPADSVEPLVTMFFYGHGDTFEYRMLQVARERSR